MHRLLVFTFLPALLQSRSMVCVSQAAGKVTHGAGKWVSLGLAVVKLHAWVSSGKMLHSGVGNAL